MCKNWECKYKDACIMCMVCGDILCPAFIENQCAHCVNNRACNADKKKGKRSVTK